MPAYRTGYAQLPGAIQGIFDTYYRRKEGQEERGASMERLKEQLDAAKREGDENRINKLQEIINKAEEDRKTRREFPSQFEPASLNIYPEELKNKRKEQLGALYQNATTEWQEKYAPMIPNIIQADYEEVKNMMTQLDMGSLPIKEKKWDTMSDDAQTALLTRYMKSQVGERYLKLATAVGITEADVKITFSWDYFPGKIDWDTWANEAEAKSLLESGRGTGLGELERMPRFTGTLGLGETSKPKTAAGLGGFYGLETEDLFGRNK